MNLRKNWMKREFRIRKQVKGFTVEKFSLEYEYIVRACNGNYTVI